MNTLPLVLLVLFFSVGVLWRSWLQRRRHGHTGWFLFRGSLVSGLSGVVASLALLADATLAAFAPALRAPLAPLPALPALGGAMFAAATFIMALAQLDLGASWRIGIEPDARPGLVTDGAYAYCRNPIFACMLLALVGFVLLLPDALTLGVCGGAIVAVHQQILGEESWLATAYGDDYHRYAARVRRYLPFPRSDKGAMLRAP